MSTYTQDTHAYPHYHHLSDTTGAAFLHDDSGLTHPVVRGGYTHLTPC